MDAISTAKRWRISVRAVFVTLTLLGVAFACVASRLRQLHAQEQALGKIAERGGSILVYHEGVFIHFRGAQDVCGTGLIRTIAPSGSPMAFTDSDLRHLRDVIDLCSVDLRNTNVSKSAAERLKLDLPDCTVSE